MIWATRDPARRQSIARLVVLRLEHLADRVFGVDGNPLRQLGALGYLAFWIVVASGAYVYAFFDTSADGAHASVVAQMQPTPHLGGLMRSLHRYASDAFILLAAAHLVREWAHGRYRRFRWFTWTSGVPLVVLAIASGIVGFWLTWDALAAWTGVTLLEWLAWIPGIGAPTVRNAVVAANITDRLFSLLVFLHIGLSLLVLLLMWVHVQRLARPVTWPGRAASLPFCVALAALAVAVPAPLHEVADLGRAGGALSIDWFFLGALPAAAQAPLATWIVVVIAMLGLAGLPLLRRGPAVPAARVDPENCNGCTRCFVDCPYAAITMEPPATGPESSPARAAGGRTTALARVDERLCAGCGICAGSCPSATPFRSGATLRSGIDMPQRTIDGLRDALAGALAGARAGPVVIVLACEQGAAGTRDAQAALDTPVLPLLCAGQMPPAFIEYALRHGADGIVVAPCRDGDCEFRVGERFTAQRLAARREPHLRERVDRRRLAVLPASAGELSRLVAGLARFRAALPAGGPDVARNREHTDG